ncbi:MAG: transcription antitermination factor NusB [Christensenellales bacterium]|jgi:N utilization substance protein B
MSRKIAREIAMKLAFARLLGGDGNYSGFLKLSGYEAEPTEDDMSFAVSVVSGVEQTKDELDHYIGECSHGWSVDRMPTVDLCILRIAAYEMIYRNTSAGIAINEAVELAKQFGGDRSPNFVNGVLGGIARAYEKGLIVPAGDIPEPAGE